MTDLRTRAEQAKTAPQVVTGADVNQPVPVSGAALPADVDTSGIPAEMDVSVYTAWSRVMAEVQYVGKGTSKGLSYEFRGIDAVLNAVGPALRKHGVTVVQTGVTTDYQSMQTKAGSTMRLCVATVTYAVFGPRGDTLPVPLTSVGEAFDSGDKATPKAMSVALRTFYINSLAIPTNQPAMDPEYGPQHEIAAPAPPTAEEYAAEIQSDRITVPRLLAIRRDLTNHRDIGETEVVTMTGDSVKLIDLLTRVGREKQARTQQS
jgi:ERF superfamily protein